MVAFLFLPSLTLRSWVVVWFMYFSCRKAWRVSIYEDVNKTTRIRWCIYIYKLVASCNASSLPSAIKRSSHTKRQDME